MEASPRKQVEIGYDNIYGRLPRSGIVRQSSKEEITSVKDYK